jgi:hypothetical protein
VENNLLHHKSKFYDIWTPWIIHNCAPICLQKLFHHTSSISSISREKSICLLPSHSSISFTNKQVLDALAHMISYICKFLERNLTLWEVSNLLPMNPHRESSNLPWCHCASASCYFSWWPIVLMLTSFLLWNSLCIFD